MIRLKMIGLDASDNLRLFLLYINSIHIIFIGKSTSTFVPHKPNKNSMLPLMILRVLVLVIPSITCEEFL